MPDDDVLDLDIPIPVADDGNEPPESENGMSSVPPELHEQNLGRLTSAGISAHEHFVTFGKVLDYSYEQDRKMVSLVESLGVREVTSVSGQKGIPQAAAGQ